MSLLSACAFIRSGRAVAKWLVWAAIFTVAVNAAPNAMTNSGINFEAVPAGVLRGERWLKVFTGDRVDAVLRSGPTATARVWLDGLPVSRHPEVRSHGPRPGMPGQPSSPLLQHVMAVNQLVPERWTVAVTEIASGREWFKFRVDGSVTGFDGEGRSDRDFLSTSGRVQIIPMFWVPLGDLERTAGVQLGYAFSWDVEDRFRETITTGSEGTVVTLAAGLRDSEHILELEPLDGTNLPVAKVQFATMSSGQQWGLLPLKQGADYWTFVGRFTAYFESNPQEPVVIYEAKAGNGRYAYYTPEACGDDISFASTDRTIEGIRLEYYANYSRSAGWTLNLFEFDPQQGPKQSIFATSGDIQAGGGVIEVRFPYDPVSNRLPERLVYTVQFTGVGIGSNVAGLIVTRLTPSTGDTSPAPWQMIGFGLWTSLTSQLDSRWVLSWRGRNGASVLRLTAPVGYAPFHLEAKPVMSDGPWSLLGELVTDRGGLFEWVLPADPPSQLLRVTAPR